MRLEMLHRRRNNKKKLPEGLMTMSIQANKSLSSAKAPLTLLEGEIELKVPLAIGTLQWGTTWVDDHIINSKGVLRDETCQEIIDIVSQYDITLFDTAEGYGGGTSEKRLGRLLDPSSKSILLMTKFLPVPWRAFHRDLEWAVRHSCHRLKVDCIPIYLLHSPVHWRSIEYWVEACAKCRGKGLIKAMGLSNCNADQVRRAVVAGKEYGITVVCNQVHYSLLDYNSKALQEMERTCRELNVKIIGFSAIGQGLLTENLTDERFRSNKPAKMLRLKRDDIQPLRAVLQDMATKYDKSMAQVALNWCIQHGTVPLVGCRSPSQARDSVGCLGWSLSKQDVEQLDQVALDRSTLESPSWRRAIFVTLFGIVNVVCRTLDLLGFGSVIPIKKV